MSLINDMLRDLDRRGQVVADAGVQPVPAAPRRRWPLLAGLVAASLAMMAVAGWIGGRSGRHPLAASMTAARTAPPSHAAHASEPQPMTLASSDAPTPERADATRSQAVAVALPPMYRLSGSDTRPTADTAPRLHAVGNRLQLTFAAPVTGRLRRMESGHGWSLDLAPAVAAPAAKTLAALHIEGVRRIVAQAPSNPARLLLTFQTAPDVTARRIGSGHGRRLTIAFMTMQRSTPPAAAASASASAQKTPRQRSPGGSTAAGSLHKSPVDTPQARANALYAHGTAAMRSGDAATAADEFRQVLKQWPADDAARLALGDLLLQQGRRAAAAQIDAEGVAQGADKPRFARLGAELALQDGDLREAVRRLRAALPPVQQRPAHYALLAGLEQKLGHDRAAVTLYRAVLTVRPGNGVWWTGLGISLERLGQPTAALDAYRHALGAADGTPAAVVRFVNARVRALER